MHLIGCVPLLGTSPTPDSHVNGFTRHKETLARSCFLTSSRNLTVAPVYSALLRNFTTRPVAGVNTPHLPQELSSDHRKKDNNNADIGKPC